MASDALAKESASQLSIRVLTAFAVFMVLCFLLSFMSNALLGDPDTQWHIASGRMMLKTLSFPVSDPFSHTFAGQPWIAKEWGGQVALAMAYGAGGWSAVTVLAAASAALAYGLVASQAGRHLEPVYVVALVVLCVLAGSFGLVARPHIVTLPLFALFTMGLLNAMNGANAHRPPLLLVPLMVVWANGHGLFTLGFVMAAAAGLHALINVPANERLRMALLWFGFGLALLVAACITPYGWKPMLMTLTLAKGEPTAFIKEWEPLAFEGAGLAAYGLLAITLIACLKNPKLNLGRILIIGFFGYLMARHMRFALQFSVVVGILGAAPLAALLPANITAQAGGKSTALALATGAVGALFAAVLAIALPDNPPPSRVYPLAALNAAEAAGLTGPVYNSYDFGGFLTLEGVPTFVDGRTDQLFIGGFRIRLEAALTAESPEAFADFIKPYKPNWAIITPKGDEERQLTALGWQVTYSYDGAVVLKAP
jgi:hypothetical protein